MPALPRPAALFLTVLLFPACAPAEDVAGDDRASVTESSDAAPSEPGAEPPTPSSTSTSTAERSSPVADPTQDSQVPGQARYGAELVARLATATAALGEAYEPRTHHFAPSGAPLFTNRLIHEDSPYLLQHAHNPVDWYPWGDEAFAKAKAESKPIFLSIGYSTCHWCHVMERESFENVEIARFLNEHFVSIKIDRERRPDIDELYMTGVQLISGRGGWPMSNFLLSDGKPFFGGTYYPPAQFMSLLRRVRTAWKMQRGDIEADAADLTVRIEEITAARGTAAEVGETVIQQAVSQLLSRHDAELGGFSGAPKFPNESDLLFLLQQALRAPRPDAVAALGKTLDAMARGGIYDQVGGGFHRYSTDAEWLVPHFEKMLYNQAHLARAYLASYALTGDTFHARIARQTLDYVRRDLTSPTGGFYSATDADSEGSEGTFFLWTPAQLKAAFQGAGLGAEDAELAIELWGVTETGNFEHSNILYLPRSLADVASAHGLELAALLRRVDGWREILYKVREEREHPLRDDKILTAWNGMMITAFAEAHMLFGEDADLESARRAAELLWSKSRRGENGLWRVLLGGKASIEALQEDYAYLIEAFVALYDATSEPRWLQRARILADAMIKQFWDPEHGGFFMSAEGTDPHLLARPKSPMDGATPSGSSVAVRALTRLTARTGEASYTDRARSTVSAFSESIGRFPSAFSYMLMGADDLVHGEAGPRAWSTEERVAAQARFVGRGVVEVELRIEDGWHVNSHEPLQDELIPTRLELADPPRAWSLVEVTYPEPETVTLGFQDEPLAVYEGTTKLRGRLTGGPASTPGGRVVPLAVRIQACNDEVCLRPETLLLELSAGAR